MEIETLRLFDPQSPITLRFGKVEEGEIEWDPDSWTKMRIMVSDGDHNEWFMTPISLDGRPYSLMLSGHDSPRKGRFLSTNGKYVMEVREMVEGDLLRECYDHSDGTSTKEKVRNLDIPEEEMSPMAQLFVHVVLEDDVSVDSLDLPDWLYMSILSHL